MVAEQVELRRPQLRRDRSRSTQSGSGVGSGTGRPTSTQADGHAGGPSADVAQGYLVPSLGRQGPSSTGGKGELLLRASGGAWPESSSNSQPTGPPREGATLWRNRLPASPHPATPPVRMREFPHPRQGLPCAPRVMSIVMLMDTPDEMLATAAAHGRPRGLCRAGRAALRPHSRACLAADRRQGRGRRSGAGHLCRPAVESCGTGGARRGLPPGFTGWW